MKVLIVEDELTNRLLLQGLLSRHGECHVACTGEEALEAFQLAAAQDNPYQLICMDIMMPGIDGVQVVSLIRQMEANWGLGSRQCTKIVMTTSVTKTKEVFRSFNSMCDAYLTKPLSGPTLDEHLRSLQLID